MARLIIGLTGEGGSGKGTLAQYLKDNHGASTYRFSNPLGDILRRVYVPTTRENLINLSIILRKEFGENLFAKTLAQDVQQDTHDIIVIDGIRRPADIEELSKLSGFHLVYITADMRTRFERILVRGEKVGESDVTWERFQEQEKMETEASIKEVAKHAEASITNNGSFKELHSQAEQVLTSFSS